MQAMNQLLDIMARMRAEGGCPWDREQTLDSIQQYLVEECYEVIDAIDSGNIVKHKEELGDLLLQIVFQAQIRKETDDFTFEDVVHDVCEKLIRRHPHVFGDKTVFGAAEVLKNWEAMKAQEKQEAPSKSKHPMERRSIVEGIPRHLPALHKAHHIQKRVARIGFDWNQVHDVVAKVEEELAEVKQALAAGEARRVKEEIGDLLFAVVNLSRFQGLNAEEALDRTVDKFVQRFQKMEKRIHNEGRDVSQCSLAEMDAHWNAVKAAE